MVTRHAQRSFDRIAWEQAELLGLATVRQLSILTGRTASSLRHWAGDGRIHPVAQAPGGAFLYHVATVLSAAKWIDANGPGSE